MSDTTQGGLDIAKKLRSTFHLAGLRMLAEMGLKGKDQSDALSAILHFDQLRSKEEKTYRAHYDDRVNDAIKRLLNEAGQKDRFFQPGWAQQDKFDKSGLRMRAERQVRFTHKAVLSLFDRQETRTLEEISKRSEDRAPDDISPVRPRDEVSRENGNPIHAKSRSRPRSRD
ncbi:MAG: hypothetical protein K0U74_05460 [Alphaproteobacteria bacterium]|nr:hypothetical protein [Alphaproteobacteria bacterium]